MDSKWNPLLMMLQAISSVLDADWRAVIKSRTVWFGIIVFVLGLAEYLMHDAFLAQYPGVTSFLGVLIVILRFLTTDSVTKR